MADRAPLDYPVFQAFDANGDPLVNGKVEFFDAGTTNQRDTYSDPGLTTANPNPVTLNSRGEPESGGGTPINIYLDNQPYKIVLKDSDDVTVRTIDDYLRPDVGESISAPKDPINATDVGTDVFEAVFTDPKSGEVFTIDFQSSNTTTTPTLENTNGSLGALTLKTRDGNALWAGAINGVHEIQYDGTDYLVTDTIPDIPVSTDLLDEDDMASDSATAVPTQQSVKAYTDAARRDIGIVDFSNFTSQKKTHSDQIGQIDWFESLDSPVIGAGSAGAWNEQKGNAGAHGMPIFFDGRWRYYHSGMDAGGVQTIGLHISNDVRPYEWTDFFGGDGVQVLDVGAAGAWDETEVYNPCVILHDGQFVMWYTGKDSGGNIQIGSAFTRNGLASSFNRNAANPVLSPGGAGEWDEGAVGLPSVVWDGGQFVMAYTGITPSATDFSEGQIGIATSPDGVTWTKHANNPVLTFGGSGEWDERGVLNPVMWIEDGKYYLNYSGKPSNTSLGSGIGHAYATDIGNWTKDPNNPMISRSDFDEVEQELGNVIRINGIWYLFANAWADNGTTHLWYGF